MKRIVFLEVTSWRGISIGAEHYYGHLISYNGEGLDKVELKRKLTAKDAVALNKKDSSITSHSRWKAGEEVGRFDTREQVKVAALKAFAERFNSDDILLMGRYVGGVPGEQPLSVPEEWERKFAALRGPNPDYKAISALEKELFEAGYRT